MRLEFWIFNLHWLQLLLSVVGVILFNLIIWIRPHIFTLFVKNIGNQIMMFGMIMLGTSFFDNEASKLANEIAAEIILMHLCFILSISWQAFLLRTKKHQWK